MGLSRCKTHEIPDNFPQLAFGTLSKLVETPDEIP